MVDRGGRVIKSPLFLIRDVAFHVSTKCQVTIEGAWMNDDSWFYRINPTGDMNVTVVPETDLLGVDRAR